MNGIRDPFPGFDQASPSDTVSNTDEINLVSINGHDGKDLERYKHLEEDTESKNKFVLHGPQILTVLPDIRDVDVYTACKLGWIDRIEQLIQSDPNLLHMEKHSKGGSPLHMAAHYNQTGAVDILLRQGCNVDAKSKGDSEGTAMHWAAKTDAAQAVALLSSNGANVNARDVKEQTPLHYATLEGNQQAVYALVACGADIAAVDIEGDGMMHCAASKGHITLLRFFKSLGLDINQRDKFGQTALHACAISNHYECAKFLLDHGADETNTDVNGYTPFQLALRDERKRRNVVILFSTRQRIAHARKCTRCAYSCCFSRSGDSKLWNRAVPLVAITSYIVYFGWVHPFLSTQSTSICLFSQIVMWLLWAFVCIMGPGTLLPTPARNQEYQRALAQFSDPKLEPSLSKSIASRLCHTCCVVRGDRVHHSTPIGACIIDYDHYCDFMNQAIGLKNRRHFLIMMILLTSNTTFITIKAFFLSAGYPCGILFYFMWGIVAFSAAFCLQLTLSHMLYITKGLTLAEAVRRTYPKGSPYNRGPWRNWVAFCSSQPTSSNHVLSYV
eukprot:gene4710-6817_t